jgi:sec-independent protein translocase protein TatA
MMNPLIQMPGGPELILIAFVIILLFGAKKLPELARGSGRALRIFKSETKGLVDGDETLKTAEQLEIEARQATLDADRDRLAREQTDGA